MQVTVSPGQIQGTLVAPPSKSMMQRVCAAVLLHKGKTIIDNPGISEDDMAALKIIQQLGATIINNPNRSLEITSKGVVPISDSIGCGESGLSARLFAPIAALSNVPIRIKGIGSLPDRPMDVFGDVLPQLGVSMPGFNGYIPFTVQGPLKPKNIEIDGSVSSQFLSGLLFALSYDVTETVTITVNELKSKPYIDLTLDVLKHFGKPISNNDYESFTIDPSRFKYNETIETTIEGDWSSAAALLVAAAINGSVTIQNLRTNSNQADEALLNILKEAGAKISATDNSVSVKSSSLKAFEYDATDTPDLFPILSILAAGCEGESYIQGVSRLFQKESDRAKSISELLSQFGVHYSFEDDILCITGGRRLKACIIDPNFDHRIVMAASVGALNANGPVTILHAESVNKSYPNFFKDLALCGVKTNQH